ncbi:hypothetical protein [Microbulbifer sp. NBRC 101763]|uniref:hypothetical protein n=1 Tax=Microbulbifer sp. NBRC 101763 TaxID=1113820 RepID=UPI00333E802F
MITIKDDLAKLEKKLGKMERRMIPKAASQAINRAVRSGRYQRGLNRDQHQTERD